MERRNTPEDTRRIRANFADTGIHFCFHFPMHNIKIRYNTEKDKTDASLPAWRVLVEGVEHLAEAIEIKVPCWTTQDEISPGLIKWHISCSGTPVWENKICKIV